jgi:hypothetical protein
MSGLLRAFKSKLLTTQRIHIKPSISAQFTYNMEVYGENHFKALASEQRKSITQRQAIVPALSADLIKYAT